MKNDKQKKKVMRGEGAEATERSERAWKMPFVILLKRRKKDEKKGGG